jgi:hypothetical protein
MAQRGARLDRDTCHPSDVKFHRDDMVGLGKGTIGRYLVAEMRVYEDVVRRFVPDGRRPFCEGGLRRDNPG